MRTILLDRLEREAAKATEETVLAELLGLRTILLNLLFTTAKGETMTAEQMQAVIERADAGKLERARKLLASHVAAPETSLRKCPAEKGCSDEPMGTERIPELAEPQTGVDARGVLRRGCVLRCSRSPCSTRGAGRSSNGSICRCTRRPGYTGCSRRRRREYRLIDGVTAKGQQRLALAGEVEAATNAKGQPVYVLTEEGRRHGLVRLVWDEGLFNDRRLHEYLAHWIYRDQTVWDYIERPAYAALGVFVCCCWSHCRGTGQRALVRKYGRRLRGPELVTTAEFNGRHEADGMAFVNEERGVDGPAVEKECEPLGARAAPAGGDALSRHGRFGNGQERGHPANAGADLGARRDGHRLRPGHGIPAAVLLARSGAT